MLFVDIILPVFLIIFSGYLLEKYAQLDFRTLTQSGLYLFAPALVLSALLKRPLQWEPALNIFYFMLAYTAALLLLSVTVGRLLRFNNEIRSALSLTTVMMNVGNFGLPLAYFAFGDAGLEYSILTFVMFNIPLGTVAIVIAQGKAASFKAALLNTLKIPIFHAVVVAFLWKWLNWPMPSFVLRPLELLGQAAVPLMMVLLGMQLYRTKITAGFGFVSLASCIRLVVAPLLAWVLTGMLGMDGLVRQVVVLQTSTPAAVLPLLYSVRFNTRPDLVASAIFVSTLFSAATLTVLLYLLTHFA